MVAAPAGDTELVYLVGWFFWFILLVKQEDRDGLALHVAPDKIIKWVTSLFSPHGLPFSAEKSRCMGSNYDLYESKGSRPMCELCGTRAHLLNRRME